MSIIFPTAPAKVIIEPLPIKAEFISYNITRDSFKIKAWMPENFASYETVKPDWMVADEFSQNNCRGCDRYRAFEHPDDDEYCGSWFEGGDYLYGEGCPLGHELKFGVTTKHDLSHIVVEASYRINGHIDYRMKLTGDPFRVSVRAGDFTENGVVMHSPIARQAANIYGNGAVCWGSTNNFSHPKTIREAVTQYSNTPFNNDLLRLDTFTKNMEDAGNDTLVESTCDKFLCAGYEALMLIDGERDVQAFYTMLTAGFRPFPEAAHMMAIPMEQATIKNGDNLYFGYTTKEDAVGRKWYVSSEGYLIGQMNESFVKV